MKLVTSKLQSPPLIPFSKLHRDCMLRMWFQCHFAEIDQRRIMCGLFQFQYQIGSVHDRKCHFFFGAFHFFYVYAFFKEGTEDFFTPDHQFAVINAVRRLSSASRIPSGERSLAKTNVIVRCSPFENHSLSDSWWISEVPIMSRFLSRHH